MREAIDMRDILFRGKRADTGEWIEGFYGECYDFKANAHPAIREKNNDYWKAVIPESVSQYTGKNDKSGRRIFSKDIVTICGAHNFYGEVDYSDESASYWVSSDRLEYYIQLGEMKSEFIKVVGNAIDNPEMLEGK